MSITWDSSFEASPANTDDAGEGDDRIRELKTAVRERLEQGGHLMQDSDPTKDGIHATDVDGSGYFRVFHSDHANTVFRASDTQVYSDKSLYVSGNVSVVSDTGDGLEVETAAGTQLVVESNQTVVNVDGESQLRVTDGEIRAENSAVFKDSDGNELVSKASKRTVVFTVYGQGDGGSGGDRLFKHYIVVPYDCTVTGVYAHRDDTASTTQHFYLKYGTPTWDGNELSSDPATWNEAFDHSVLGGKLGFRETGLSVSLSAGDVMYCSVQGDKIWQVVITAEVDW